MTREQEAEQAQLIMRMSEQMKASREVQEALLEEVKRLRHDLTECRTAMVRELDRSDT